MFLAFFVNFFSLIVEKNLRVCAAYKLHGALVEGCEIDSAIFPHTFSFPFEPFYYTRYLNLSKLFKLLPRSHLHFVTSLHISLLHH